MDSVNVLYFGTKLPVGLLAFSPWQQQVVGGILHSTLSPQSDIFPSTEEVCNQAGLLISKFIFCSPCTTGRALWEPVPLHRPGCHTVHHGCNFPSSIRISNEHLTWNIIAYSSYRRAWATNVFEWHSEQISVWSKHLRHRAARLRHTEWVWQLLWLPGHPNPTATFCLLGIQKDVWAHGEAHQIP